MMKIKTKNAKKYKKGKQLCCAGFFFDTHTHTIATSNNKRTPATPTNDHTPLNSPIHQTLNAISLSFLPV